MTEPPILEPASVEEPEPEGTRPNAVPVKIHLKNGKTFVVDDINSWVYEDMGVFASGKFKEETTQRDILIPYPNVEYYELQFARLQKYIERKAAEEANRESPSA